MQTKLAGYITQFENWLTLKNYAEKRKKCYLCAIRKGGIKGLKLAKY